MGNIPPLTRVNIWITYITELKIEADESTRFLLPTAVAPRYSPSSSIAWHTPWYEVFSRRFCLPFRHRRRWEEIPRFIQSSPHSFSVMVEIEAPSLLLETVSPSHAIQIEKTSDNTALVSFLHGNEPLGKDFILDYKISEPHKERAIIECEDENADRVSAMVTLVPDFALDDVKTELIFVVDRSGSMSGKFINQAKEGLQLFLRGLPMDCYFNIIGFGSSYTKLYEQSKKYSQATLNEATSHINGISANLGGTELMKPLQFIYGTPLIKGYTRNIFVLTDGQVSNTEQVCKLIRDHNSTARVFSLGVGEQVSHDLVEGMARAGKGNARFIVDGQRMDATIMRQLKDSIQPALTDISIDWGFVVEEEASISPASQVPKRPVVSGSLIGHRSKNSTPVPTPRKLPACYCQAPFNIPPIFSGTRFIAYAFLRKTKGAPAPRHITITAQSPDGPLSIELEVEEHSGNLVQKLTARSLIRDLEEGSSWLHSANQNSVNNSQIKAEIVRLGTTYNLVSKHTSFIAVEQRNFYYAPPSVVIQPLPVHYSYSQNVPQSYSALQSYSIQPQQQQQQQSYGQASSPFVPQSIPFGGGGGGYGAPSRGGAPRSASISNSSSSFDNYCAPPPPSSPSFANYAAPPPSVSASYAAPPPSRSSNFSNSIQPEKRKMAKKSKNSFSSAKKCEEKEEKISVQSFSKVQDDMLCISMDCNESEEDDCEEYDMSFDSEPLSPLANINNNNNNSISLSAVQSQSQPIAPSKPQAPVVNKDSALQSIVLLQQFDGSFKLDRNIAALIRLAESEISGSVPASIFISGLANKDDVWVTLLVIQFFAVALPDLQISWELIADKSKSWLRSLLKSANANLNTLLAEAKSFLESNGVC